MVFDPTVRPGSLLQLIRSDISIWSDVWYSGDSGWQNKPWLKQFSTLFRTQAGFRATVLYRLSHWTHRRHVRVLPLLLSHINITLHGLDVAPHVPVGARLYVPHPVGTVVNASRVGDGVTLVSGVTIGMRNEASFPTIGDNVYIGAGARVLGEISVGDDVLIGANAVVIRDCPEGTVATGVPAVCHQRAGLSAAVRK